MLRGYRLYIVALGLILVGAHPPKVDGGQPSKTPANQTERSPADIAAAQREIAKPSDLDKPCKEGNDERNSDLCAQWKAADAAASGADATWLFGGLSSLIGAFTLAAAGAAAIFAKKAADYTKVGAEAASSAVDETKRIGEAQLRAYLQVTGGSLILTKGDPRLVDKRYKPTVKFMVRNHGQSPGRWFRYSIIARYYPPMGSGFQGALSFAPRSWGRDIGVGDTEHFETSVGSAPLGDAEMEILNREELHIDLVIRYVFEDVFGAEIEDERVFTTFVPTGGVDTEVKLLRSPLDRETIVQLIEMNSPENLARISALTGGDA